ncbi:hypothetical protein ACIQ8D_27340 [Streptomyces sp. NPDC096094]|uniref:hypothetical protein n=1 Tax=Streptomyces sp. NPDC096094 TaxID=3366073 RepID=UPI003825ECFC
MTMHPADNQPTARHGSRRPPYADGRPPRREMRRGGRLRTVRQHGVTAINFSKEAMQSGQ